MRSKWYQWSSWARERLSVCRKGFSIIEKAKLVHIFEWRRQDSQFAQVETVWRDSLNCSGKKFPQIGNNSEEVEVGKTFLEKLRVAINNQTDITEEAKSFSVRVKIARLETSAGDTFAAKPGKRTPLNFRPEKWLDEGPNMLKWLVQKGPDNHPNLEIITEDPLATVLPFDKGHKGQPLRSFAGVGVQKVAPGQKEIYSVNR